MDTIKDAIRTRLDWHAMGTRRLRYVTARSIGTAIIWISLGTLGVMVLVILG